MSLINFLNIFVNLLNFLHVFVGSFVKASTGMFRPFRVDIKAIRLAAFDFMKFLELETIKRQPKEF